MYLRVGSKYLADILRCRTGYFKSNSETSDSGLPMINADGLQYLVKHSKTGRDPRYVKSLSRPLKGEASSDY